MPIIIGVLEDNAGKLCLFASIQFINAINVAITINTN